MDHAEARQILTSLVDGHMPGSADPIPSNCVLHRADVLRAMLISISALESVIVRSKRRALLPNNIGQAWTHPEEERLRSAFLAKEPVRAIAARHRRTLRAVEARLQRMGLITAEERVTRGGFGPTV